MDSGSSDVDDADLRAGLKEGRETRARAFGVNAAGERSQI
jgi:hypothetical protein